MMHQLRIRSEIENRCYPLTDKEIVQLLRDLVVGVDVEVPVLGGGNRRYINFDNAASTPALKPVLDEVLHFLSWYCNVHRGAGFKSKASSWAFDQSRERISEFVHGNQPERITLFAKNTTEAINHVARRFPLTQDDVVVTTMMEHHSNDLPWRRAARVVHVRVLEDGRIDEEDFQEKLYQHRGKVRLVAVTGASNVTGYVNPIHRYAQWAHACGAKILVDAAQLVPHRAVDMKLPNDPNCIDYLAFSAHKMYAPFGVGVLVGERSAFEEGEPDMVGGGTIDIVNLEHAHWTDLPEKEEAGTPSIVGVVALAAAIEFYQALGWESITAHEEKLTSHALRLLRDVPYVRVYGESDPLRTQDRLGVISFNVSSLPHALVAAILSHEWAIGTRNGCFCAHPYVKSLLNVEGDAARSMEEQVLRGDRSMLPGMVRVSFGLYNTTEEIETLRDALEAIVKGKFRDGYKLDEKRGEYYHEDLQLSFHELFRGNGRERA